MGGQPIYLSKDGKVTGPYTLGQIEELRQSGELYDYSWIWESSESGWQAIEEEVEVPATMVAPPPPDTVSESTKSDKFEKLQNFLPFIKVICHNRRTIMSGKLATVTEAGCTLQSFQPIQDLSTFKIGANISMNLLNSLNGSSENTFATVEKARRGETFWEYDLTWASIPNILSIT